MTRLSPHLTRLLIIRGIVRALAPLAVVWGIYDWYCYDRVAIPPRLPWHALVFALLAGSYIVVYILNWVAPDLRHGPWRVRPWHTFVLLINFFLLPIQFYRHALGFPWGFVAINILFFVGLYVATAIMFYFQDHLPMAAIWAARKAAAAASSTSPVVPAEASAATPAETPAPTPPAQAS
jgi:hypothetical protein